MITNLKAAPFGFCTQSHLVSYLWHHYAFLISLGHGQRETFRVRQPEVFLQSHDKSAIPVYYSMCSLVSGVTGSHMDERGYLLIALLVR
jgi:hypothetical protein